MVSVSLPAFAVKKFDTSVFSGRDDICVSYDDMTATTSVYPRADILGETYINLDSGMIFIDPGIEITAISNVPLNVFFFGFRYFGYDWADLNEIIIKIGDNRYSFQTVSLPNPSNMIASLVNPLRFPSKPKPSHLCKILLSIRMTKSKYALKVILNLLILCLPMI